MGGIQPLAGGVWRGVPQDFEDQDRDIPVPWAAMWKQYPRFLHDWTIPGGVPQAHWVIRFMLNSSLGCQGCCLGRNTIPVPVGPGLVSDSQALMLLQTSCSPSAAWNTHFLLLAPVGAPDPFLHFQLHYY